MFYDSVDLSALEEPLISIVFPTIVAWRTVHDKQYDFVVWVELDRCECFNRSIVLVLYTVDLQLAFVCSSE